MARKPKPPFVPRIGAGGVPMSATEEVRHLRRREASRSVKAAAVLGSSGALAGSWVAAEIQRRYHVPIQVTLSGFAVIVSAWHTLVGYRTRGGRKGETE